MRRIIFYLIIYTAVFSRLVSSKLYNRLIMKAHAIVGVKFNGVPEYIDYHSHLDPSGGLSVGADTVISTNVIILTHDWSFLKKIKVRGEIYTENLSHKAFKSVEIGDESFIGAGAILLPGTKIGKYCIVGAGAIVKGSFEDYSVIVGSPARKVKDIRD